jgi:hypothetical protein
VLLTQSILSRWRLSEIALNLDEDEKLLPQKVAEYLQCPLSKLIDCHIVRCGIDARRKGRVLRVYTMEFTCDNFPELFPSFAQDRRLNSVADTSSVAQIMLTKKPLQTVVVGMGPGGLFSALWLARSGHPVVLLERGCRVEQRVKDVESFWNGGSLQGDSNVQFGEGGAGTFSDGKLTSRLKHPLTGFVLRTLVEFGAPEDILYQAKPHIGTDRLRKVLINFRRELQRLGVELCFNSCLTDISPSSAASRQIQSITVNESQERQCDAVVLAIGHSARDTYTLLERKGFMLQAKPFAMGVRVEHPAALINGIQYGTNAKYKDNRHPNLPTADYSLAYNDQQTGRGTYSFCMCPGGQVVQSSSEAEMVVVNGMSDYRRAAHFSNSALVVAVRPEDFADTSALAGVRFQRHWEHQAFIAGGKNYAVPAQNMLAFLGQKGTGLNSGCRPGIHAADLGDVLPDFVVHGLRQALPHFERKMRGFVTTEATLTGIESRTSAPLRILRDTNGQAVDWQGVYPVGEGAGYAGGIMSAAIDGVTAAINICAKG